MDLFEDPEKMLVFVLPLNNMLMFVLVLIIFCIAYWMRSSRKKKKEEEEKEREEKRRREEKERELAPAWLLVVLHGMSELNEKFADDVKHLNNKIDKLEKTLDNISLSASGVERKEVAMSKKDDPRSIPGILRHSNSKPSSAAKSKSRRKN